MKRAWKWLPVLLVWAASCQCANSRPPAMRTSLAVSDVFLKEAAANDWFLVSGGCFYRLDEYVDCLRVPEPGATPPFGYVDGTQHFDSFDYSPVTKQIVLEQDHLVIADEGLSPVFEDPKRVYHQIYSKYRWSPDGNTISFAHANDVILLDVAKRTYTTIASDHAKVVRDGIPYGTPTWSADSKFVTYQTNDKQIVILDVATKKQERVGEGCLPSWSPDGTKIAYLECNPYKRAVKIYDTATKQTETLFVTGFDFPLLWSPDSRYLVFGRDLVNSIYSDLRVYAFDTGKFTSTGKKIATMRGAQIEVLPESFRNRLVQLADPNDNPNRRK